MLSQKQEVPFAPLLGVVGYGSDCLRDGEWHSSYKMDLMSGKKEMLAEDAQWLQHIQEEWHGKLANIHHPRVSSGYSAMQGLAFL